MVSKESHVVAEGVLPEASDQEGAISGLKIRPKRTSKHLGQIRLHKELKKNVVESNAKRRSICEQLWNYLPQSVALLRRF